MAIFQEFLQNTSKCIPCAPIQFACPHCHSLTLLTYCKWIVSDLDTECITTYFRVKNISMGSWNMPVGILQFAWIVASFAYPCYSCVWWLNLSCWQQNVFFFTDDLISTIKIDIDSANIQLEKAEMKKFQDHSFFQLENKDDKIVNGVKSQ
jgi:hypothetical protein